MGNEIHGGRRSWKLTLGIQDHAYTFLLGFVVWAGVARSCWDTGNGLGALGHPLGPAKRESRNAGRFCEVYSCTVWVLSLRKWIRNYRYISKDKRDYLTRMREDILTNYKFKRPDKHHKGQVNNTLLLINIWHTSKALSHGFGCLLFNHLFILWFSNVIFYREDK